MSWQAASSQQERPGCRGWRSVLLRAVPLSRREPDHHCRRRQHGHLGPGRGAAGVGPPGRDGAAAARGARAGQPQGSTSCPGKGEVPSWASLPRSRDLSFPASACRDPPALHTRARDTWHLPCPLLQGLPVVLDAGGADTPLGAELLSQISVFSPNETELARITGLPTEGEEQVRGASRKAPPGPSGTHPRSPAVRPLSVTVLKGLPPKRLPCSLCSCCCWIPPPPSAHCVCTTQRVDSSSSCCCCCFF